MLTKEDLTAFLLNFRYKPSFLYYGEDYVANFEARVNFLESLIDQFYEVKPDEIISRVLDFEKEITQDLNFLYHRQELDRNFSNICMHYTNIAPVGFFDEIKYMMYDEFPSLLRASTSKEQMGVLFEKYVEDIKCIYRKHSQE